MFFLENLQAELPDFPAVVPPTIAQSAGIARACVPLSRQAEQPLTHTVKHLFSPTSRIGTPIAPPAQIGGKIVAFRPGPV
jgi:hypothetical protein